MDYEAVKRASGIYFNLLQKRVVEKSDELYSLYFQAEVREAVKLLASESGTQVIETSARIHLVTRASGSVFATHFTHLKSRHKEVENKKYFYCISIILMVYLAEIDRNQAAKIRSFREGHTFFAIERLVSVLVDRWTDILKADGAAVERRSGIAIREMVELWRNADPDPSASSRPNRRTRLGLIRSGFKLLEEEGLVHILDRDELPKVFPRQELVDRLEYLYGDSDRYAEVKALMEHDKAEGREGEEQCHGSTVSASQA
ncbi:hypothetical protein FHS18_005522 [Paenibacillus phyllosphaerae]|uniref:Uncharacterized protein n=1 Tax=Paenibacillus phyllosphaerae TaxID=274593 RepID=A0A7W5FQF0_9BACL|nr:DUF6063 family protein [Paenibacillus phyllosphaerae]MBB3113410.1 hypothetical protein [Paenibacillus phyllosphaerae]